VRLGDVVIVDIDANTDKLQFFLDEAEATIAAAALETVVAIRNTGDSSRKAA
jgi:hypothetical protein